MIELGSFHFCHDFNSTLLHPSAPSSIFSSICRTSLWVAGGVRLLTMSCPFNHLGIMSSYWSESEKLLLSDLRVSLLRFLGNLKILQVRVGRVMVFSAWPSSWQAHFCTYGISSPVFSWLGKSPCCSKLLKFWAATTLTPLICWFGILGCSTG